VAKAGADAKDAVDALMANAAHPLAAEIGLLRGWMLRADASISEGVKWNAPSFRTHEWFATVHLRSRTSVQAVMHLGVKVRAGAGVEIDDPDDLLRWLAKDRAMIDLGAGAAFRARKAAMQAIARQWIAFV
jgi:hypothetical protein